MTTLATRAADTTMTSADTDDVTIGLPTEQILRQYAQLPADHPRREALRTRAIENNMPLARRLARRYTGRGEPLGDLTQVAALALVRAVDNYDPGRQTTFAVYAVPCILGALKRHFRDNTWSMRVPRQTQELAIGIGAAVNELSQRSGRTPTRIELAQHMCVSPEELTTALGALQIYHMSSLNQPRARAAYVDATEIVEVIGGLDPQFARVDDLVSLLPLLAALPERQRRIVHLRFYRHMTQSAIAAEVGLSQMHVSRLLQQALLQLRAGIRARQSTLS
jgi:RNA polymerase sigma-B factor